MTKRRGTGILCTLLAVIISCICEWITIIIGNPNTAEKIISSIIYTYLSMFACIDLFYAINGSFYYSKEYHLFSFFKQLALTVFVAIILILILGKMNVLHSYDKLLDLTLISLKLLLHPFPKLSLVEFSFLDFLHIKLM